MKISWEESRVKMSRFTDVSGITSVCAAGLVEPKLVTRCPTQQFRFYQTTTTSYRWGKV
jgi:hypothetical protein